MTPLRGIGVWKRDSVGAAKEACLGGRNPITLASGALVRCNRRGASAWSKPEHNNSSGLPPPVGGGRVYRSDVPRFGAGRGMNSWCRLSRRGQGRTMGSFMGRGRNKDGVGISVPEGKRKESIPKQNSFVPTSSASNLEYVPATVLMAGCVKQGNAWQAPAISKVNNRESEERRRNIDSAESSEIHLNSGVCVLCIVIIFHLITLLVFRLARN